jgi:hypothetical protein
MLRIKIGDHPSNISIGDDVQRFSIFSFSGPLKGQIKFNMNKLDKRLPKIATDKIWLTSIF